MRMTATQRQMLETLWYDGPLSRSELCERMGVTANATGEIALRLQQLGFVEELPAEIIPRGRPKTPLQIDARRQKIIGLSVSPHQVEACRIGFGGDLLDEPLVKKLADGQSPLSVAAKLLPKVLHPRTILIAMSVPGLIDQVTGQIVLSSAFSQTRTLSLKPIFDAAAGIPLVVGNDLHAAAAHWALSHRGLASEDVLLVNLADGQIGAAMLINGRPNRGCILGANELGHTKLPINAPPCYCGGHGCLERIFSSQFLQSHTHQESSGLLAKRLTAYAQDDATLQTAVQALALALSNAVNFVRPSRLVIATSFAACETFMQDLRHQIQTNLLAQIASRVDIQTWDQRITGSAHLAAWLGIAGIILPGWSDYEAEPLQASATRE
ncbi:MAG: ROK family transcriptional regulator [Phycisphaerales bacterium]|nr:ROK family transcriptional regulator [Phycisphaerales bacterium]